MKTTNAMRLLTAAQISFRTAEYEYDENDLDGHHAAEGLSLPYEQVFKTLVTRVPDRPKDLFVFCIPVCATLDMKKAAVAAGQKRLEMVHVKELFALTGYIRGGCSPVGMKKAFPTFIDENAQLFDFIAVSAGERGVQLLIAPDDLCSYTKARYSDLIVYGV